VVGLDAVHLGAERREHRSSARAGDDTPRTVIAFALAIGIPRALSGGALWFAVPYVALRGVGLLVHYWVARR
jgi:hypothetical protein